MKKSDRKKIKNISETDDFYDLFNVDKSGKDSESFEELLKASESNMALDKILETKKDIIHKQPISVYERIKTYPPPQSKCDLHGLTSTEAESKTETYLITSKQKGLKTVRVVTGKGHHSDSGPVLRDKIESLANRLKKNRRILGWKWEKRFKEKSGSIIFFLNPDGDLY